MKTGNLNWETWLVKGDQYLNAATPKGEKSVFRPEIRYNILSMAFESYVMAILDYHHTLPDNHTYTDLMMALETVIPVDENLKYRILKYENIQSICSIEKYHTTSPSESELIDLKAAIVEIYLIAHDTCDQISHA